MEFSPQERQTEFRGTESKTRERKSKEPRLTADQLEMARSLNGISEKEYIDAVNKSLAYDPHDNRAAEEYLDPNSFVDTGKEPELEVRFEAPKTETKRYKMDPNSKTAVKLSPAEVELIQHMSVSTGRPLAEVKREFAEQKLRLHSGKAGNYQLYDAKLASEGHR